MLRPAEVEILKEVNLPLRAASDRGRESSPLALMMQDSEESEPKDLSTFHLPFGLGSLGHRHDALSPSLLSNHTGGLHGGMGHNGYPSLCSNPTGDHDNARGCSPP